MRDTEQPPKVTAQATSSFLGGGNNALLDGIVSPEMVFISGNMRLLEHPTLPEPVWFVGLPG